MNAKKKKSVIAKNIFYHKVKYLEMAQNWLGSGKQLILISRTTGRGKSHRRRNSKFGQTHEILFEK
jgi:hypothetical protein